MRWTLEPGHLAIALLLVVGSGIALSVDVVRSGFGVKGDEATYVSMALSVAYDGDLAYERRDLERFYEIYDAGPEGLFLKRGSRWAVGSDRLYFGKAYVHALAAAPFVRLAGLNGLLLLNVVLLACILLGAYEFLAAQSAPGTALPYALAFFGISIVPLYAVLLTPEIFNVAAVFLAYFFWFYKEVARPPTDRVGRLLRGRGSDLIGAVLLALATFSKPSNLLLIGPPVLWLWSQRRFRPGLVIGVVFGVVVAAAFGLNGAVSGEVNYQGGERRTYYGRFPFENPDAGFADLGISVTTNAITVEEPLTGDGDGVGVLARNVGYFMVGRHFGFVPFFFPGVVTLILAARRRSTLRLWHGLIAGAALATAATLVFLLPYNWSGGGGPLGNRYYLSIYPVLLFLTPPLQSSRAAVAAWAGGALFTAQILVNPFVSAKQPYLAPQQGPLRLLPVELTMVNDLPIRLDARRSRVPFGEDPRLLLYFLDGHASLPEPPGIWISGGRRAEIIVRTGVRLEALDLRLEAPVANRVTLDAGGSARTVEVEPGRPVTVPVEARGVRAGGSWAYLLSIRTADGFVPRLTSAGSNDPRFLGVAVTPRGRRAGGQASPEGPTR